MSYVAPEVLNKSYTSQCDLWSLGVASFILLLGYMPFSGKHALQVRSIRAGCWTMRPSRWNNLSAIAQDFIQHLLVVDPDERMTADQALQHDFIVKGRSVGRPTDSCIDESIKDALAGYVHSSRFRRACMSMMAFSLTNEERAKVRNAFLEMDKNNTGAITLGEFKQALSEHAIDGRADTMDENIRKIFDRLDHEQNEVIHYHEFLAAMVSTRIRVHDQMLRRTFMQFDKDKSGYITVENLRTVLGETFDGAEIEELISEADANCDGQISFEEFTAFLERQEANSSEEPVDDTEA
jgi:calcium-dependent protein kinase